MPIPADLLPLTVVTGEIFGPDGLPHGGTVTFTLQQSFVAGDPPVLIVNDAIPVTANPETGYFTVGLLPGDDPDGIPFAYDVSIEVDDDDPDAPTYPDFAVVVPTSDAPVNLFSLTPAAPITGLSAYARIASDETITGSWRFLGPVLGPDGLPFGSGTGTGSSSGTTDHQALTNRTSADAHPLTAITGLTAALAGKQTAGDYSTTAHSHIDTLSGVTTDFAAQYLNQARGDVRYVLNTARGSANGVATLGADGKLTAAQVPPFAVGEVFVVANEAAMLALTGVQPLDVARRTDTASAWLLLELPATDINNWAEVTSSAGDATTSTKGVLRLGGDLSGTADAPTVPGLAAKADASALASVALSGDYADLIGSPPATTVADATATTRGIVTLAGDLAGTADSPTLAVDRVRSGNFVGRLWLWETVADAEAAVGAGESQPGDLHFVKGA